LRKWLIAIASLVLLLVVAGVLFWVRPEWRFWAQEGGQPPGDEPTMLEAAREIPPLPAISLQIDTENGMKVYTGTPLIFSVRLANPRAMNAAAENASNQAAAKAIEAAVATGKIPKEKADRRLAHFRQEARIRAVQLGDESAGWEQFVRFTQRLPDGKQQPLAWPLKLAAPPEAKTLTLDAKNTAQLDYLLEPAATSQIATGDYQILAVLEVPADAKVASDRWRGRVESGRVKLSIMQKPARMAPEEEEKTNLQFARYYQAAKDWTHALESAQKALAANPKSIPALILVGEVKETRGDLRGALEAFQTAEAEFYRQYPKSYEAPLYLIHKSAELLAKLKATP